jgi:hypothetical protein
LFRVWFQWTSSCGRWIQKLLNLVQYTTRQCEFFQPNCHSEW